MRQVVLTLTALCTPLSAAAQWANGPGTPAPLSQSATAADANGNVYIFNGRTSIGSFVASYNCAHRYNMCTNQWTTLPPLVYATHGGEAVYRPQDNGIWITGGLNAPGGTIYRYDIATNTFSYSYPPAPTATNSWQPAWVLDSVTGLIHWIGGEDWGTDHLIFNPGGNTWATAAPPPIPTFAAGAAFDPVARVIVVISGWGANDEELGVPTTAVQRYDTLLNTWSYGAPFPGNARIQHAVAYNPDDGLVYVYGGSSAYTNGAAPRFADFWTYDVLGNTWAQLPNNPLGGNREMGGVWDSNGYLHLMGGDLGSGPVTRQQFYNPLGNDLDGDGFMAACGDCNDNDATVHPGAPEQCDGVDDDCDGTVDEGFDQDGDGFRTCDGDCDDSDPGVYPGAPETCDNEDDDCDGLVDEGFDQDGDGWAVCEGDCDDGDAAVHPGATEVCNNADDDCDGVVDEGFDQDGDGFAVCDGDCDDGDSGVYPGAPETCDNEDDDCDGLVDEGFDQDGDGVTTCGGDCDDGNAAVGPGASEICNGADDDCDGLVDEGFDQDGDGVTTCGGDCDDANPAVSNGTPEVCNGVDDDCDGLVDEGFDQDGDGVTTCGGDCDDGNAAVFPGATELCNGTDDDCDGLVDEGFDQDGDGFSTCGGDCDDNDAATNPSATEACDGDDDDCDGLVDEGFDQDGDGYTSCGGDCDDFDADVNPGQIDDCNGVDDDCDGIIDGDGDGDGVTSCDGDCDDTDDTVYPGAEEICDGQDNDCDGATPPDEIDWDGDGQAACDGDCNDGDPDIYDGAPEFCDNVDTDCDGIADNGFDQDGDGIPDCVDACPMIVTFDTDPWGEAIAPGDDATFAYQNWGITIERFADGTFSTPDPAPVWDSGSPPVGYEGVGTPNEDFGGPGIGSGGASGALGENAFNHENIQLASDGNTWWLVNFSSSTCVHAIDFLDVGSEELPAQVILFDVNVQTIATITSSGLGTNSRETLDLGGICGVFVMMIDFYARGGWDNLVVCVDPTGGPETCGNGLDDDGDGFVDEGCPDGDDDDDDTGEVGDDDDDNSGSCYDDNENGDDDECENPEGCNPGGGSLLPLMLPLPLLMRRRRR